MRFTRLVAMLLAVVLCAGRAAADCPDCGVQCLAGDGKRVSQLGFLETGKDYVIHFAGDDHPFRKTESGVTQTQTITADGKEKPGSPATYRVTRELRVFRVVRVGDSSWALLEHPRATDDYIVWSFALHAQDALAKLYLTRLKAERRESPGSSA